MKKIWKCLRCKRIFKRAEQQHSCTLYPIEKHFERKEYAKELYTHLKNTIKSGVGQFRVESLPCCIHFVTEGAYTFAAVFALKDKIRLHLSSGEPSKSSIIKKTLKISSVRYLYSIDITNKKEIDSELMGKIKQAFHFVD